MKTSLIPCSVAPHRAVAAGVVLLVALSGCAQAPLRHASSTLDIPSVHNLPPGLTAPMPIHPVAPEFPRSLRRAGIEGFADIYCLVDANGGVWDVTVLSGSDTEFASSAREAVTKWRFAPATRHGRPVTTGVVIPFQFVFEPERRLP